MTNSSNVSPAPTPVMHECVKFKRLPRWSWEMVIVVGIVLAFSADGSSVKVGYISPSSRKPTTAWVERTQLIEIVKQAADEAFFAAPSA